MLHGYFRTICKYKWMEILRTKSKFIILPDDEEFDMKTDETVLSNLITIEGKDGKVTLVAESPQMPDRKIKLEND